MNLEFCSFASGSSGNSYMIKSENTTLIVDVGISGKRIEQGLLACGSSCSNVDGILITHEHSDHIKSIKVMQKKCPQAKVYLSQETWEHVACDVAEEDRSLVRAGEPFEIGDIRIEPFALSHDADGPTGYSFCKGESKLTIVTDTGYVSDEIYEALQDCSVVVIEANHDEQVLLFGGYPYHIKQRILSEVGHLSNETCAKCMARLIRDSEKVPNFFLAHLSNKNNTPDLAMATVLNVLDEENIYEACGKRAKDLFIEVLKRDEPGRLYQF